MEEIVGCCPPLAREPLSSSDAAQLAGVLRVVADATRLRILSMILARDGGEVCVCDLTEPLGLTQPTVSHHLKLLLDAGLVSRKKRGPWSFYRVESPALSALADLISPARPALTAAERAESVTARAADCPATPGAPQ